MPPTATTRPWSALVLRRHTCLQASSSTTSRLRTRASPVVVEHDSGLLHAGCARSIGHGPHACMAILRTALTHVLQPDPTSKVRSTSLIRGIRGQAGGGNQPNEARTGPSPDPYSTPPAGPSGMSGQSENPAPIMSRSSLHERGGKALFGGTSAPGSEGRAPEEPPLRRSAHAVSQRPEVRESRSRVQILAVESW